MLSPNKILAGELFNALLKRSVPVPYLHLAGKHLIKKIFSIIIAKRKIAIVLTL